jgi:pimeloyl-ACP methyl ester carboxylesterase
LTVPVLRRGYANCRFGQVHYMKAGVDGGAAPLVLLHQTPSSCADFIPFARLMATDRQVVAFDTPGFGMSDPPAAPLSMANYATAIADAVDNLFAGSRPLDVLGYHTGAYIAAELAIARPDVIGRLILSGIAFRPVEERVAHLATAPAPSEQMTETTMLDFVMRLWGFTVVHRQAGTVLSRALELFADRIRPMQRATWPYQGVWQYDAAARFAHITQPVLVLQPCDPQFPLWRTPVQSIRDVTIRECPDLEKDVFDVGAETLARAVRQWDATCNQTTRRALP